MDKIDNSKNQELIEVYEDQKKNKWYGLRNPLEISAVRGIAAERAERFVGLMISEKELKLALEAHSEAAKKFDVVTCFAIIADLKHRLEFICEENSVLDLAGIYYYMQDENPAIPSEAIDEKKRKIWQEDSQCRAFFLHMGLALTKKFKDTPEEDLLKFMNQTREIAERIYRYIPRPTQR